MTITRKNQFEELIDNLIIDEVSGLDEEIRKTLEGLDVSKKRMAILSILDNDRDMFMKIKRMVDNNDVRKGEHIKNVVEMLRAYVIVGDREQKSHGEVFTPYFIISDMLNLVEDWSNPNLKFLDNSAGAGNIPAVIIERLMKGLVDVFPNEEDRYRHIVENMIYMAELQAKNAFLILAALDPQDTYELNIFHGSFLSEEFDNHSKDVWGVDKYDYVIMNSPYQLMDGGHSASASPLYNVFIEKSIEISDKVISIHPSRWMAGGKGLGKFRSEMLARKDIKTIIHYDDSQDVFGKNVDIRGGVQYFLIDKSYSGLCEYNGVMCNLNEFDIFCDSKYHEIVKKINVYEDISGICRTRSTYPISTNDSRLTDVRVDSSDLVCYVSKQKGFKKFIERASVTRNTETIDEYKVITARAAGKGGDGFGNIFIGYPGEICTDSYITFKVDGEKEALSLMSYMNTKFCNFFLSLRKNTQDIKPNTCKWIPLVPFDREWTDEMLFERFELTEEEIELILNK